MRERDEYDEYDDDEWDDGLTVGHIEKERRYASSQDKNDSGEDSDDSLEQIGQIGQSQSSLASSKKKNSTGKNDATDTGKAKEKLTDEESPEDDRREFIQKAASSYLNRQIELKNVAHAVNPIRRGGEGTSAANQTGGRPMLEVDTVVYRRGCANNDHFYSDGEESATSSNVGDEFDAILDGKNYNDESGEAGKLILIRMVNRIPVSTEIFPFVMVQLSPHGLSQCSKYLHLFLWYDRTAARRSRGIKLWFGAGNIQEEVNLEFLWSRSISSHRG